MSTTTNLKQLRVLAEKARCSAGVRINSNAPVWANLVDVVKIDEVVNKSDYRLWSLTEAAKVVQPNAPLRLCVMLPRGYGNSAYRVVGISVFDSLNES